MSEGIAKPEFREVYEYAKDSVEYFIRTKTYQLPQEQKEEIAQDAFQRVWVAYQNLDPSKGWKSFIQLHCRGAVLDYLKGGDGSVDDSLSSDAPDGLNSRVEITSEKEDGAVLSVEETAAFFGVYSQTDFSEDMGITPKWDLVSKLAGKDEDLAIVAKVLLGFSQEQIADQLTTAMGETISRERVSQRIYEFFEKLDDPKLMTNKRVNQYIFALGLSKQYHMAEVDTGYGHDLKSFDLNDPESFRLARRWYEPTLLDYAEWDGMPEC